MFWTLERLNAVRRDICFDGYAFIPKKELDEFKEAIGQIPLIYTERNSEYTRVELPPATPGEIR